MEKSVEQLAQEAREGDKTALDGLVCRIYDNVYGLSLRMLGFSNDAEDATQEILIKIVTHLSAFRGESSFKTWSFRIAVNHLLSVKQSRAGQMNISFDLWEEMGSKPAYSPQIKYQILLTRLTLFHMVNRKVVSA
jgi:RNA polymerase sigma factor (sigma-70 family)